MRTIDEIKESIAVDFMRNETVADLFGFPAGEPFSDHFSKVSIINILFYGFASAAWVIESLFESHRKEIETRIGEILPHRAKWYMNMALAFMKDKVLEPETDRYDTSGMNAEQIEAARVVKYATADENQDASILTIKVAGEDDAGRRCRLDDSVEVQLAAYLAEVKDAGVRINLVNREPDTFNCSVDIYYDAMLLPENVRRSCEQAVKSYIENLPFNGEYTNMALIDALQLVEGVKIAEFRNASVAAADAPTTSNIDARYIPSAGYFKAGTITLTMKPYEQL